MSVAHIVVVLVAALAILSSKYAYSICSYSRRLMMRVAHNASSGAVVESCGLAYFVAFHVLSECIEKREVESQVY
jgi:hypothetical protein